MSQSSDITRLKELFADAIDLAPADRAALIERTRAQNPSLAENLKRMLDAHDAATQGGEFLTDPTIKPSLTSAALRSVGPFKLLQMLGEGGFGEVYLAEQSSPIQRKVALKLIKPGMDSRQILARFDAERQALAIMDHPNIARVYDAGTDERGRPWFAMEYVEGDPIHTFADQHRLDVNARIKLFVGVCRAVHHAHQKGVIHRDLKPTNVLVSEVDGKAVPKVIDFGIAKALDRPLTEKTIFTELRTLVGTPEYMSPEQADIDGDIDTRSDVYSLGVLLYELLVGATPFDGKELRSRAFGEIQRILREVDPPTPSTRFSRLQQRASAAANRNIEPGKLSSSLRGELDWITMKCLEKDRARRYDSAAALADDLARFLESLPVSAGPVSRAYRTRKFVRRHRVAVVAASLIAAALLAGAAGTVWGLVQARRERDMAFVAREQADRSRIAAETARAAEAEANSIAQEQNRFLNDMFQSIDPNTARGKDVSVKEVLDSATAKIDASPPDNPNVEAALRATFGQAYSSLGALEPARKQLERAHALGELSFPTTDALIDVMRYQGDLEPAIALVQQALKHPIGTEGYDEFSPLHLRMLLSSILLKQDKHDEAEEVLNSVISQATSFAATRPSTSYLLVDANVTLAAKMSGEGRFAEAEKLLVHALQVTRDRGESETPAFIEIASNLGELYRSLGRFGEAIPLLESTHETALKVLGPDHADTLSVENNLALNLMTVGRLEESEKMYDQLVSKRERLLGVDHPGTLMARSNRALVYQQPTRLDLAEKEFADLAPRHARVLGPDHVDTIIAENNYAKLLLQLNRAPEAERMLRGLVDRARRTQGEKSLVYTSLTLRLANALSIQQKFEEAEPLFAQALAGADEIGIADVQSAFALGYGLCLSELGKAQEAVPQLARAEAALKRMPNPDPVALQRLAGAMARSHELLGHSEEAKRWRELAERAATQPSTRPTTQPAQ